MPCSGDSYIESLMNPYESTLQGRLPTLLEDSPAVYNFGIAGSALADYLGLAPLVSRDFEVEKLIVLVGEGDFVEAFQPPPGHFTWSEAADAPPRLLPDVRRDALRRFVRSLALVRYVRGNLRMSMAALFKSRPSHVAPVCIPKGCSRTTPGASSPSSTGCLRPGACSRRTSCCCSTTRARQRLYGGRSGANPHTAACPTRDGLALAQLATRAREAGMHVVELAPLFEASYRRSGRRVDHSPADWHWTTMATPWPRRRPRQPCPPTEPAPPAREPSVLAEDADEHAAEAS